VEKPENDTKAYWGWFRTSRLTSREGQWFDSINSHNGKPLQIKNGVVFLLKMTYRFYILYSNHADRFYVGHTSDVDERLRKHNSHHKGFTGMCDDWQVVYSETYATKTEAYSREREVKSWKSRKMIQKLIGVGSEHPD